ncbi:MAG: sulfite dehydrogenase [Lautropia sp.]
MIDDAFPPRITAAPAPIRKAPEHFLGDAERRALRGRSPDERRRFLRDAFAAASAAAVAGASAVVPSGAVRAAQAAGPGDDLILKPQPHATGLGQPVAARGYGLPSQYERNLQRRESPGLTRVSASSVSFCPLQGLFGIMTPSGLHFERHHQGWWDIDPSKHRFMVMGMVKEPRVYTMDDLLRMTPVSRIHFIECGANTGMEWGNVAVPTVQYTHGMLSCSEFTGVPLIELLEMSGADLKNGKYLLAEGGEGSSMTRTIPMDLIRSGEVLVAYGQNGEMLRPENGYPLRLVVPGVQGVSWVKYLRRVEVGDMRWAAKDEAVHYIDLMPDGLHRQYSGIQECKSVVTSPSGGQWLLDKGFVNITGLAWSGRGSISRVDVSVDGGRNWRTARLESPVLSKALTRFSLPWSWDGSPAILQSRAIDSTGYVQPTYAQLREVRGSRSIYHNNSIQSWMIQASGEVANVQL